MFILNLLLADLPAGNPITLDTIYVVTDNLVTFIGVMADILVVLAIVISGMTMIFSRGDDKRFQKGKDMLRASVVGAFVIFGVQLIMNIVKSIVNGSFSFGAVQGILGVIADFIMVLASIAMIIFIVISGIMMMTARDDPTKFKKARQMLINTIWGSLVILGTGVILNTINAVITGQFFCRAWVPIIRVCLFS